MARRGPARALRSGWPFGKYGGKKRSYRRNQRPGLRLHQLHHQLPAQGSCRVALCRDILRRYVVGGFGADGPFHHDDGGHLPPLAQDRRHRPALPSGVESLHLRLGRFGHCLRLHRIAFRESHTGREHRRLASLWHYPRHFSRRFFLQTHHRYASVYKRPDSRSGGRCRLFLG